MRARTPGSRSGAWSAATWQLDYVLTNGLIGTVDSNLYGYDGRIPM